MAFDSSEFERYLPHYLTAENREILLNNLESPERGAGGRYILELHRDSQMDGILQRDGWRGFQFRTLGSGRKISTQGMVLSNSCDLDSANLRTKPTMVTFAPLVEMAKYEDSLRRSGLQNDRVAGRISAIAAQRVTNMFFLSAQGQLNSDHVVLLDEIHSMPVGHLYSSEDSEKLFTLSDMGFYMLVFKLSIHFCRIQEGVGRTE